MQGVKNNQTLNDFLKDDDAKVCKKCGQPKPLDDFDRSKQCKDGHIGTCKECRREYQRQNRPRKPSKKPTKKKPSASGAPTKTAALPPGRIETFNQFKAETESRFVAAISPRAWTYSREFWNDIWV
jgi:hypothetical protein